MAKQVYIHVGLQKTGSSFLQQSVFPCLGGCDYFRGTDTFKKYVWNATAGKLLLSHEAFQGAPVKIVSQGPKGWLNSRHHRLHILSNLWPEANIIVVVRQHGEWLSSMYRQYLHLGGTADFDNFFNTESDCLVERAGLIYKDLVATIKYHFRSKILIINYNGLRKEPDATLHLLSDFIGCEFIKPVHQREINPSVKNLQARILRFFNSFQEPAYDEHRRKIFFQRSRGLLYMLRLTPAQLIRNHFGFLSLFGGDVVTELQIENANHYFKQDWYCVEDNIGPIGSIL